MKYFQVLMIKKLCLIILLVIGTHSLSVAQSETEIKLAPFLILVESTDVGLKFTCPKGCAWTSLSFSLHNGEVQAVNQEGMTNEISNNLSQENGLADFHFEVKKDDNTIYLKGLKGTAWLELDFISENGKHYQYFDPYGTRNID